MKEFIVDLVINKTVSIQANSIEEAKEKAIAEIRKSMMYSALTIEDITEIDEDWEGK